MRIARFVACELFCCSGRELKEAIDQNQLPVAHPDVDGLVRASLAHGWVVSLPFFPDPFEIMGERIKETVCWIEYQLELLFKESLPVLLLENEFDPSPVNALKRRFDLDAFRSELIVPQRGVPYNSAFRNANVERHEVFCVVA